MKNDVRPIADERVTQESTGVMAKNFRAGVLLLAALLAVKAAGVLAGLPWYALLPEAAGLLCGGMTCVIWLTARGLRGATDERIAAERARCLSASWTVLHCVALLTATALLFATRDIAWLLLLTMLAMTLLQYLTMGRMTRRGLYGEGRRGGIWTRVLIITVAVLLLAPGMMWIMGTLRQQTFSPWVYAVLEAILLGACLLGGVLAQEMSRRSGRNADAQLLEAEESDEE